MAFIQYFNEVTADRRACPADDLASVIANGEVDGCPMGDAERLWYFIIVATAGHDTTSFALSGGVEALLSQPDQWEALRGRGGDDETIDRAADEIIRWTTPVRHLLRHTDSPTEIQGRGDPRRRARPALVPVHEPRRGGLRRPDALRRRPGRRRPPAVLRCRSALLPRRPISHAGRSARSSAASSTNSTCWSPTGAPSGRRATSVSGVKHLPIRYRFR